MASKRLHKENNLKRKDEALLELEKGKTNKQISKFHQTLLSTWKKNKDIIFNAFRQGKAKLAKRVKVYTYYHVNKAVLKRFKTTRGECPNQRFAGKRKSFTFCERVKLRKV